MKRSDSKKNRRSISGILLLDKPSGITSNAALQRVKYLYNARKAGHTGSLDPLASGLLPICLGEATKLSGYLLNADKSYRFTCRLGITTTTADAEGDVVLTRPVPALTEERVTQELNDFVGTIEQLPPMYSAVKQQGKRLYELARKGVEVERRPRTVAIHELELVALDGELLHCQVRCSKGTYVRTLAEDIGTALGCGAHVSALRRTAVAPFDNANAVTIEALQQRATEGFDALDGELLGMDTALMTWPALGVNNTNASYLRSGNPVRVRQAPRDGLVRLYDGDGDFFAIGEMLADGRVAPRRVFMAEAP